MPIDPSGIQWDPTPSAPPATQAFGGRPVIIHNPQPPPQTDAQAQGDMLRNAATAASTKKTEIETANIVKPHVLSPDEAQSNRLDPGKVWQIDGQGNIKAIGDAPQPFKVGDSDEINHAWGVLDSIAAAKDLAGKPLATGTASATIASIPVISGLLGQNRANLQTKLGQIAGDLRQLGIRNLYEQTGSKGVGTLARNQSEQQALQSSQAAIGYVDQGGHAVASGPQPDEGTLDSGLNAAQDIYVRHLARMYGLNPDDPEAIKQVSAAVADPSLRGSLLQASQRPNAMQSPETGAPPVEISTGSKTIAPNAGQQAAADKLGVMIARGMPLANIQLYAKTNGLDYLNSNLADIVRQRDTPGSQVAKWLKQNPDKAWPVNLGGYDVPLTGTEKARAEVSGSPVGATLAGMADVGSFGALPDVAGEINNFSGGRLGIPRAEVIRRQETLGNEFPTATAIGDAAGGLTSLEVMGAPTGLGRLALQSGALGATHGFLSSEDPSLSGRTGEAVAQGLTSAAAAPLIDLGLRGVAKGGKGLGRYVQTLLGDPEAAADAAALDKVAAKMPPQDVANARAQVQQQRGLGVEPAAANVIDRSGQNFLARATAGSPQAQTAANAALDAARAKLPKQIAGDFTNAIEDSMIDPSSNGDKTVAEFLNRPAREITSDIQDMAGREFEGAIKPIYHEPVPVSDDLLNVLSGEQTSAAIRDALRQPGVTPETKAILRSLPRQLAAADKVVDTSATAGLGAQAAQQVTQAQQSARDAMLQNVGLNVESAWRIRSALQKRANKMAPGEPEKIALNDLAKTIGDDVGPLYPEWADASKLYASRQRAIDALGNSRDKFLSDTDAIAAQTGRNSATRGEPGQLGGADSEPQAVPSEQEMAMAGAREAASDAAGKNARDSAETTGIDLSGSNQMDRNRMVFGDAGAQNIEARAATRTKNVDTLDRIATSGTGDTGQTRLQQLQRAAANWGIGRKHAAAADLAGTIRGLSNEDAGRIVDLYTTPGQADALLGDLEKRYGQQKARFIVSRLGAMAASAAANRGNRTGANQ